MTLDDWRETPPAVLEPLYAAERERWARELRWDTTGSWREVEQARVTWGLPGFLARDADGRTRGFVFFLLEQDRLEIGGLVSDDPAVTGALLDGVLAAARAASARTVRALLPDRAPAIETSLRRRGFEVEPYLYLSRACGADDRAGGRGATAVHARGDGLPDGAMVGPWRDSDVGPVAALLRRAYGPEAGALFAPGHEQAEWERYVHNLVTYGVCGTLNREATQVVRLDGEVRGIALMTDLSAGIGHVVQLAVDPAWQGQGHGATLLRSASAWLGARHYTAITLMVSAANTAARALYARAGFRQDATFLAATRRFGNTA